MTNSDDTLVLPATQPTPPTSATVMNQIVVIAPPVAAPAPKMKAAATKKPPVNAKPFSDSGYYIPTLPTPIADIKTEYQTDAVTGARSSIYKDGSGNQAVFIADPSDHNKVTLKIKTKDGDELITYGHERGFDARVKNTVQEASPFPIVRDTLTCGTKKADITTNQAESATRDKLQQFAQAHPDLARALKGVDLPVTVAGALPINFKQAVEKPSEYRACPNNDSGIVLERLTEKSATR